MSASPTRWSRRTLFAGAGTATALAAAAALLPAGATRGPVPPEPARKPARGGGYALSEHVRQYYRSARV